METKRLIDLAEFRNEAGLRQQSIAQILGVSSAYISMVETGKTKLSRSSIDKLYGFCEVSGLNFGALIPAYGRLLAAIRYHDEEMDRYPEPGDHYYIPDDIYDKVKYGEIAIPENIVNELISHCPEMRKEWLASGIGPMIYEEPPRSSKPVDVTLSLLKELSEIKVLLKQLVELEESHKNNI